MTSRPLSGLVFALCVVAAGAGCRPADDVVAPASPNVDEPPSGSGEVPETTLQELFGMPVPPGAELEESGDSFAHYNVPGTFEGVVADFREGLDGYRVVEYDEGVKFEPRDGTARSLYVLQGGARDSVQVTYFNEEVAVASNAVADSPTGATRVGGVPGTPEAAEGGSRAPGQRGTTPAGSQAEGASVRGGGTGGTIGFDGILRRVQPRSNAPARGTTNPLGRRPIDFTGVFEAPTNPNAYY